MTDTVTLQQAMEDAGTGDVGLLEHSIMRCAPGLPKFDDPGVDGAAWDKVKEDVRNSTSTGIFPRSSHPMRCRTGESESPRERTWMTLWSTRDKGWMMNMDCQPIRDCPEQWDFCMECGGSSSEK